PDGFSKTRASVACVEYDTTRGTHFGLRTYFTDAAHASARTMTSAGLLARAWRLISSFRNGRTGSMSRISRRQLVRGALFGAAAIGAGALAEAQQPAPEVTRAGAPGSAIIPPNG